MKRKTLTDELRYHFERYGVADVVAAGDSWAIEVVTRHRGKTMFRDFLRFPASRSVSTWDARDSALAFLANTLDGL